MSTAQHYQQISDSVTKAYDTLAQATFAKKTCASVFIKCHTTHLQVEQ